MYNRFADIGIDDSEFEKFLKSFINGIRYKEVDGKLFDKVDETGSTKDKSVINEKLHILEKKFVSFCFVFATDVIAFVSKE